MQLNFLGGRRDPADEGSLDTCFREFLEESGGLLTEADIALLRAMVTKVCRHRKWGYALRFVVLPELRGPEAGGEEVLALVKKLHNLPTEYQQLRETEATEGAEGVDPATREMEHLHWVDVDLLQNPTVLLRFPSGDEVEVGCCGLVSDWKGVQRELQSILPQTRRKQETKTSRGPAKPTFSLLSHL